MLKKLTHFFVLVTMLTGLFALYPVAPVRAFNILTVDNLTDDNDGSCTDGDCSLREAISSAVDGDSINVVITGTIVLTDTLTIDKSITINGPGTSQLTLDGDNKYRIFNLPNDSPTNTIHISDMTMTKGYADPTVVCGGGAINSYAFLTLDHVVITDNHAPADLGNCFYPRGGGILFFNGYGSLTLTNSTVSNNSTYYGGGGIYFNSSNGNISLNNVTVDNNRSDAADGGGIYVYNSLATATITNSIISNNDANGSSADGGGLYLDDHSGSPITAVIENTNFQLNTAGGNGGGIFTYRPITTILDSTFNTNSASGDGGGLFNFTGNVTINSSTFNGNTASGGSTSEGGAIYNLGSSNGGSMTIVNSTLDGNSALGDGGAIYNQASGGTVNDIAAINIYNSTIVSNNAVGNYSGGGIFASTASGSEVSTVSLFNSILYANTLTSGTGGENCRIINSATISLNNHNLLQNLASDCNPGASDVTSNLARPSIVLGLTNNGGATQTMALPNGSPAIDAGDPAICAAAPVNNASQNEYTRSLGGNCDIGAYELDNILLIVASITRVSTSPTSASIVDFTVTFSEDVTGVSTSAPFEDFQLVTSGVSGAAITGVSGSGSVYTVSVNTGSGNGTIRLDLPVSADITDFSGTPLSNLPYTGDESYSINKTLRAILYSTGSQDGWVLESSETSESGGTVDSSSTVLLIGDDASDRQYRSMLSFDTSSLPDTAVITQAVLSLRVNEVLGGGNPIKVFNYFMADMRTGSFGASSALAAQDFGFSPTVAVGPLGALNRGGWYYVDLKTGKSAVNTTGLTQVRLRFSLGDNDNGIANIIKIYSGNSTVKPQLSLWYYVP